MLCHKCGNELPQSSDFCPYCMNKLVEETKAPVLKEKSSQGVKKTAVIIAVSAFVVILSSAIVLAVFAGKKNDGDVLPQSKETPSSETGEFTAAIEADADEITGETQPEKTQDESTTESTSEKTTSTTAATVKKTSSQKEQIKSKYKEIVRRYAAEVTSDSKKYYSYYLYDINDDGVKELITEKYDSTDRDFYTFKNGKEVYLGSFNLSNTEFMIPRDGNGLLMCFAHMSYCSIARLTVSDNDAIKETYVYSADDVDDYYMEFAKYAIRSLEGFNYNDFSALDSL